MKLPPERLRAQHSEVWSAQVARNHHLLSQLEFAAFFQLEPRNNVVDIREQFHVEVVQHA